MTRLEILCNIFGWKGGTIFQAEREVCDCLELWTINIISMRKKDFTILCKLLKREYPKYKAYVKEYADRNYYAR